MTEPFTFDYLLVKLKAIQRSLDELGDTSQKVFNALIRIENLMRENTEDLREYERS